MVDPPRPLATPRVLELRVHGINNTSPAVLLDLPVTDVERVAGDALGSFWSPTRAALERQREAADAAGRRGYVPRRIRREAYSWGGLVRSTPSGTGLVGVLVAGLARIGWALLLPFSIANAAAWAWRLPTDARTRRLSLRAGIVRVFCALLTLLFAATVATLAVDLVARQCYRDGALLCTALPTPFTSLADWTLGQRRALLSLVPVAVVLGLWLLSTVVRLRYDVADRYPAAQRGAGAGGGAGRAGRAGPAGPAARATTAGGAEAGGVPLGRHAASVPGAGTPDVPLLASPNLWSRRGETHRLSLAHLAAGIGLASFLPCALTVEDAVGGLGVVGGPGAPSLTGSDDGLVLAVCVTSGVLVLAGLAAAFGTRTLPVERVSAVPHGRWHTALVGLAAANHAAALVVLAVSTGTGGDRLPASAALRVPSLALIGLVGGMLACILLSAFFRAALGSTPAATRLRFEAWHGRAPAVFLTLALGIGLILSSILTVGIGNWLNGGAGASALLGPTAGGPTAGGATAGGATAAPTLTVPIEYPWFGGAAFALVLLAALVVTAALLRPRRVGPRLVPWLVDGAGPGATPAGSQPVLAELLAPVVDRKRATAARLHLVEPVVGIIAGAGFLALVATVLLSLLSDRLLPADAAPPVPGTAPGLGGAATDAAANPAATTSAVARAVLSWLDLSMGAWSGIAVLVLLGLVLAPGPGRTTRPLAIVWDLACFLPRAGHPLGAPCYTERAVPEVGHRILSWLRPESTDPADRRRQVVLAAHSMGAVVSVAALFALASRPDWAVLRGRVSLLTFGVQLRPYFGRFFPELLGPDVLGTTPCLRPRLWATDPWAADARAEPAGVAVAGPAASVPARRWISLWRATDPLGFPARSNRPTDNPIDSYAEEIDAGGYTGAVDGHGEYYRTDRYRAALAELAGTVPPGTGNRDPDPW